MFKRLREDVGCVLQRDPAATSALAVILTYPGLHALLAYRLGNRLWRWGLHTVAELVAYAARIVTGIEIHPGATIGRRVFIDHGSGVVIGGTAEIGDDVTLYQGVTLGGTSLEPGKRHPTLGDGVIVGANATLLGPITVNANARVGANAVVLRDVPEYCTAVGVPARIIRPERRIEQAEFLPYGTPLDDLPDPIGRALRGLMEEVTALRHRVGELEGELGRHAPVSGFAEAETETAETAEATGEDPQRHCC
ncbi:MAG: serine O-acetyltransferase [Azospirillaceae bacterium]